MNWENLSPVSPIETIDADDFKKLTAEAKRINAIIERVVALRAKADATATDVLERWQSDKNVDRTAMLEQQLAALEAEAEVRPSVGVFYTALNQATRKAQAAARDELHRVVESHREWIKLPPDQPIPLALLQTDPHWWAARQKEAAIGCVCFNDAIYHNDGAMHRVAHALPRLRGDLATERRRVKQAAVPVPQGEQARWVDQKRAERQAVAEQAAELLS